MFAAIVLAGCAPKLKTVEDEPISAAWLEYFDLSSVAVIGGIADGDAFLGYTGLDGESGSFGVHLGGPVFGLVMDMTVDPEWGPSVPFDLSDAETDPVMLSDVLGTYRGTTASGVIGAGIDSRQLHNKHNISLQEDHFAFGIGLLAGWEWIRIREGGSETGEMDTGDDSGAPADDSSSDDTANDDSANDDSGNDDSGSDDSGGPDDSGGSGSGSGSGGGQGPPPSQPPPKRAGDGCDGNGSSSSSSDDGCCCGATNSAFIVGVWLLLGGRRRRQRS